VRALVVGGAGFLGSHLVDRLIGEGHSVDVVDDLSTGSLANLADARVHPTRSLSVHTLDGRSVALAELVARRPPDVIYLLAPGASGDPDDRGTAERCLTTVLNVLDVARAERIGKVVAVVDADDLHGEVPAREQPVKESWRTEATTVAAVTARATVDLLSVHRTRYGVEYTALAMADVYGPRQTSGKVAEVLGGVVANLERGAMLPELDARVQHDLVYVDDAVDALVRAAARGGGLLVNIGVGEPVPRRDVQRRLLRILGENGSPTVRRGLARSTRLGRPSRLSLSPIRARIHLGWSPYTVLADGLAETVAWATAGGPDGAPGVGGDGAGGPHAGAHPRPDAGSTPRPDGTDQAAVK
jgi:UDP-glucose 4-epimerase